MQMETIYEEEHDEVQTILDDLESIKNMIFNLQQELRATRVNLLELVHTQHKEQCCNDGSVDRTVTLG